MSYGDKRDYPKIDIYVSGEYTCTTTWARTLKEAKERYVALLEVDPSEVRAYRVQSST